MRYEFYAVVTGVEDAPPKDEFDLCKEAAVEICDGVYMRFRVPRGEAGALYSKMVHVTVEVEK